MSQCRIIVVRYYTYYKYYKHYCYDYYYYFPDCNYYFSILLYLYYFY